jgi:hypothetical protein
MGILKSLKNNRKEDKSQEKGLHFAPQISPHAGWSMKDFPDELRLAGLVWFHIL